MGRKRRELVERFGYDTKNAAHLVRLLRMGIEILEEGEVFLDRGAYGDASELLEIKRGAWELERVQEHAGWLFHEMDKAYERSSLPDDPQLEFVENLCVSLLREHLGWERPEDRLARELQRYAGR
jgi:hypothetical protein